MLSLNAPHVLFMMHFTFYIVWLYLSFWELLPCEVLALAAGGSKSFFMCVWSLLSKWSLCQVDFADALGLHSTSLAYTLKIPFEHWNNVWTYLLCVSTGFSFKKKTFAVCFTLSILWRSCTNCYKLVWFFFSFLKDLLCTRNYAIMQIKLCIVYMTYFCLILN